MNGHYVYDPQWRRQMERGLRKLVYQTENSGLSVANGEGLEGVPDLTMGDGSELFSDDNATSSGAVHGVSTQTHALASGEFSIETSGGITDDHMSIMNEWKQFMDVYGLRHFASDDDVANMRAPPVGELLTKSGSGGRGRKAAVNIAYGFVPMCCFREPCQMYQTNMESTPALKSSENGCVTSGRGKMTFIACTTLEEAVFLGNSMRFDVEVNKEDERIVEAIHVQDTLTDGSKLDPHMFQKYTVVYMGKDPILPHYVYQVHLKQSSDGRSIAIRRVQRMPLQCTVERVRWILSYVLRDSGASLMADLMKTDELNHADGAQLLHQSNFEANDDADRQLVLERVLRGLSEMSATELKDRLRKLEAITEEGDSIKMVAQAAENTMYDVEFASSHEVRRFFGGKRFAVLSRYFGTHWLCTLDMQQLATLFDTVMRNPIQACFGGKKSWLKRHVQSHERSYREPLDTTVANSSTFVPGLSLSSVCSIALDMLCLRRYLGRLERAVPNEDVDVDTISPSGGRAFASGATHAESSDLEFLSYVQGITTDFVQSITEESFIRVAVYDRMHHLHYRDHHTYARLEVLLSSLLALDRTFEAARIMLRHETNQEVRQMLTKRNVLNAIYEIAEGIPSSAEYRQVLALVLEADGRDDRYGYGARRKSEWKVQRKARLLRRMMDVKVYLKSVHMHEGMFVHTTRMIAERALAHKSIGDGIRLKSFYSQNPADYARLERKCCSEQMHALRQIDSGRPFVNMCGPGGSGKTQCLAVINEEIGKRRVLQTSFMGAHKDALMTRVGRNSRATTIHRCMSLHWKLCSNVDLGPDAPKEVRLKRWRLCVKLMRSLIQASTSSNGQHGDCILLTTNWQSCPFEDVEVLVVEEASVTNSRMLLVLLWMLYTCAPNFRLVVTAGDTNQLQSIDGDNVHRALIEGFGMCHFDHVHRFEDRVLRHNVDAIANQDVISFSPEPLALVKQCTFDGSSASSEPSDSDTSSFIPSHYTSGVFCVEAPDHAICSQAELLIYTLRLMPDTTQFITRTNSDVMRMRDIVRRASLCVARARAFDVDPQVYAIENYGTSDQKQRLVCDSQGRRCLGTKPRSEMLVFSRIEQPQLHTMSQWIATPWGNPALTLSDTTRLYEDLEQSSPLDHSSGIAVGETIQITRNVPSLCLSNLQRVLFVMCLHVGLELMVSSWDPTNTDVVEMINDFNPVPSNNRADKLLKMIDDIDAMLNDNTGMAPTLPPDENLMKRIRDEAAGGCNGDRQWIAEQLRSSAHCARERKECTTDSDSDLDIDELEGDAMYNKGASNTAGVAMQVDTSMHTDVCMSRHHEWLSPRAFVYLLSAVSRNAITLADAAGMIRDECARRCQESGESCVLCTESSHDALYVDGLSDALIRIMCRKSPGDPLSRVIRAISTSKVKVRVTSVKRTNRVDHCQTWRYRRGEGVPTITAPFRVLVGSPMDMGTDDKEMNTWVHRGVDKVLWCEDTARELLRDGMTETMQRQKLVFIPFERDYKKLIRVGACITTHGMQGSQARQVVLTTPRVSSFNTWNHVYSGSSRPMKLLVYLGSNTALRKAILTDESPRMSDLGRVLRTVVHDSLCIETQMPLNLSRVAMLERFEAGCFGEPTHSIEQMYRTQPCMSTVKQREAWVQQADEFAKTRRQELRKEEARRAAIRAAAQNASHPHTTTDGDDDDDSDNDNDNDVTGDVVSMLEYNEQFLRQMDIRLNKFRDTIASTFCGMAHSSGVIKKRQRDGDHDKPKLKRLCVA